MLYRDCLALRGTYNVLQPCRSEDKGIRSTSRSGRCLDLDDGNLRGLLVPLEADVEVGEDEEVQEVRLVVE